MADQSQKVKGVVDIVFLIDVTGSMQPCIDALKNNISTFIEGLSAKDANNAAPVRHWRAKAVGYRDFLCDKQPYVDAPFIETAEQLRGQLAQLQAEGGGDEPESLLDALYRVANMPQMERGATTFDPNMWRYRSDAARVVIVFTDASYHPTMAEPAGGTINDFFNLAMSKRIILSIFAPNMSCYDELSGLDKSEFIAIDYDASDIYGAQKALAAYTGDQANFRKTLQQLAASVTKSAETPLI